VPRVPRSLTPFAGTTQGARRLVKHPPGPGTSPDVTGGTCFRSNVNVHPCRSISRLRLPLRGSGCFFWILIRKGPLRRGLVAAGDLPPDVSGANPASIGKEIERAKGEG